MITGVLSSDWGDGTAMNPGLVLRGVRIVDMLGNEHPSAWDGLLDTGADRTVIPLAACHTLGIRRRREIELRGFDRSIGWVRRGLYYVCLRMNGLPDVTVLAAGVERNSILLGRDFLFKLRGVLAVDTQAATWQIGPGGMRASAVLKLLALC